VKKHKPRGLLKQQSRRRHVWTVIEREQPTPILSTKAEARLIAANIAKLPDLLESGVQHVKRKRPSFRGRPLQ
jgi:hypothetical protein